MGSKKEEAHLIVIVNGILCPESSLMSKCTVVKIIYFWVHARMSRKSAHSARFIPRWEYHFTTFNANYYESLLHNLPLVLCLHNLVLQFPLLRFQTNTEREKTTRRINSLKCILFLIKADAKESEKLHFLQFPHILQ